MSKTIDTAFGPITLRRPLEREVLAKMQKRLNVETGKFPVDASDDGDEEILDCVTAPEREQIEEWLDDAPLLIDLLERAFDELAGGDTTVQPAALSELPEEVRAKHPRLVAVRHGGQLLGLTKVTRIEFKLIKRNKDYMAAVAQLGRGHLVHGGPVDSAEHPTLAAQLGTHLLQMASKKVEGDVGKSPSSSVSSPPPKS